MGFSGCNLCLTESPNDPDWLRKAVERRKLIEQTQSNPFIMEMIPKHLQSMILTKMDQTSFTRMRRTNNHFSHYIDKNRHTLKIALFHNCSIRFEADDSVYLSKPGCNTSFFIIGKNFRDNTSEESEISSIDFEKCKYNTSDRSVNDVRLYLKAFKQDKWLQKELTGVLKLNGFSLDHKLDDETYGLYFLTSLNIESVSLRVSSGSSQLVDCCLQTLKPKILSIRGDERIRLGENVKDIKVLYINNTCVDMEYRFLRNVEILEISDPSDMPNSFDVMKIFEMWCLGESNLRVMIYSTSFGATKIPLFLLNGDKINDFRTRWLVSRGPLNRLASDAFPRDIDMIHSDPPEAYKLYQKTTKEIAVAFFYENHVLFKKMEKGDRLLEPIPKKPKIG